MMSHTGMFLTGLAAVAAFTCVQARADVFANRIGPVAPPETIEQITVTPLPFDDRIFSDVWSVPDGYLRSVQFDLAMSVRQIGFGWATWSHGFTGNVYYSNGQTKVKITFPRGTKAAYVYFQPNPFGVFGFTIKGSDGNQVITHTDQADGSGGAVGWAFYTTPESDLIFIEVSSDVDFALGEFGISEHCPADLDYDQFIDFSDFLIFLNYYDSQDLRADFTQDGLIDFGDYLEFLNYYGNSCED